jgi:hypothetical protein
MILLDGAQGLIIIPFFFVLHMLSTILIEGSILYWFDYKPFKKSLWDAFLINLCSLIIGVLCLSTFENWAHHFNKGKNHLLILLGIFFIQTVLIEGFALRWLNKEFPPQKAILSNLIMNVLTYIVLYFILKAI